MLLVLRLPHCKCLFLLTPHSQPRALLTPPTHNREPYDTLLYYPKSCPYRSYAERMRETAVPLNSPEVARVQARAARAGAVATARGSYPADRQPVRGAALCAHARRATTMSGNYMFVMVGQGDTPIYEAEFLNTQRVRPAAAPAPPAPPPPPPLPQALTSRLCPRPRRHRPRCAAPRCPPSPHTPGLLPALRTRRPLALP